MGAELLRHQSSRAYFDGNNKGCIRDLFRFLDLHQHLQKRKMLSYRRQGDESNGGGTKFMVSEQKVDLTDHIEHLSDRKANFQMKKKPQAVKKSSGKASMLTLIYQKLTNKKNRKLKSSSKSRLLHTISTHHLECNDYVLPDEIISDSDSSTIELSSHEIEFPSSKDQRENISLIPRENIPSVENNAGSGNTVVNLLKEIKQKIKDVIKENKKKEHRISMDGVLDKVPIDHKLHDEVERDKRNKFGSEGFVRTNSKLAHKSIQRSQSLTEESSSLREPTIFHRRSNSVNENRNFGRSHSLSESLDRYSRLLESVSVKEPQRVPQRLNSIKEQDNDGFAKRRTLRSHSLGESFDIYSRLLESVTVGESQRLPLRSKESNFAQRRTLRSRSVSESFDVYSRLLESVLVNEPKIQADRLRSIRDVAAAVENYSFDETNSKGSIMSTEETMETDISVNQNGELSSGLIDEHAQSETCIISEERAEKDSISEETEVKEDPNDKCTIPSWVSVLDSWFEEDPVCPTEHAENQGAEWQSSWIQFEEQDSSISSENILADRSSEMIRHFKADLNSDTTNSFEVNDDEFNYVKDVLERSGFSGGAEEFLAAWLSSYEPIDQLLVVEESSLYHQLLLDLINKALLEIYESTIASSIGLSRFSPRVMPVLTEDRVLKEVWVKVSKNISLQNLTNQTLERIEAQDFAKNDGWMNLAWDVEELGVELEGLILDDLVDEIAIDFRDLCEVC